MKNILMIGTFLVLFCGVSFANVTSSYKVNNASIDAVVSNAVEVTSMNAALPLDIQSTASVQASGKNPWGAWLFCTFLGEFGVHRHYMGTKGGMWAIYTFTICGIFGVVPLVDWIVLLIGAINNDISKYENNTKFFMW